MSTIRRRGISSQADSGPRARDGGGGSSPHGRGPEGTLPMVTGVTAGRWWAWALTGGGAAAGAEHSGQAAC